MPALHANDTDFDSNVTADGELVLVDFWAQWCGPCRAMSPVVDEVADDLQGKAKVVKVNVDEAPEAAAKYGIQSIPAFVLFKNGEVIHTSGGMMAKDKLAELVESHA